MWLEENGGLEQTVQAPPFSFFESIVLTISAVY